MKLLDDTFINSWVLAKDLPRIAESTDSDELRELCELLEANYSYPVDSLIISPDGTVLDQRDVTTSTRSSAKAYRDWLENAIAH